MVVFICVVVFAFIASFVQGLTGFGFGMIAMATMPFLLPLDMVVPLVAINSAIIAGTTMLRIRKEIAWREATPILIGGVLGTPVGILFLRGMNYRVVEIALGVVICVYSLYSLKTHRNDVHSPLSSIWGYVAGSVGGVLGGAFNMGGPPVIAYVSSRGGHKDAMKSILVMNFFLTGIMRSGLYVCSGMVTTRILEYVCISFPFILLSGYAGHRLYGRISRDKFLLAVNLGLFLLGFFQIIKPLIG